MGKGLPPTSFSPGVSTNVKISPKKLVSTLLPHLHKIKRLYLLSEQLLNLNQEHTSKKKKWFSYSNPYEIELMITSLLELPNLGPYSII